MTDPNGHTGPTDPADLPPAPPLPLAGPPSSAAEPWQVRLEVLALLLVAVVVIVVLAGLVSAYAQLGTAFASSFGGDAPGRNVVDMLRLGGTSAGLTSAGALLVALLLVTLGPGDRIGGRGTTVLRSLVVVGLVTAGIGGTSAVLNLLHDTDQVSFADSATRTLGDGFVGRLSGVAPLLLGAVLAGYVAWCAFSTLGEVPPEPVVRDLGVAD